MNTKEKYFEVMNKRLEGFYYKIDNLDKLIESKKEEVGNQYDEVIMSLKEKKDFLNKKKEEIKKSSESAFGKMKEGYENAVEELETSIENAYEEIK